MRVTWKALPAVAVLGVFALSGTSVAAEGETPQGLEPGQERGATVVKSGWWWAANEPPPDTGVLAGQQPPSPNIPKGAMPVGAVAGDAEKVSAIEFALDAEPGSSITKFRLVLRESADPMANANAENAKIAACPVTELFWADGSGAAWKNRPVYDCKLGLAEGVRDEDGLWRFDLSEIAAEWAAEDFSGSRSVVLVEQVDAPESFQVSFDGFAKEGVGLKVLATEDLVPDPDPDPVDEPAEDDTPDSGGASSGGGSLSGGGGSSGGSLSGGGDLGGDTATVTGGEVDKGIVPVADEAPDTAAAPPVVISPAWYSGLPRLSFLLVPLVLGLAYLVMVSLGPDARPGGTTNRHGVSRALDRLRQSRRGLTTGASA